jgi:hypothetical protein
MGADALLLCVPLIVGLLTFVALELAIFIAVVLQHAGLGLFKRQGGAGSDQALKVVLTAPELIEAIRGLGTGTPPPPPAAPAATPKKKDVPQPPSNTQAIAGAASVVVPPVPPVTKPVRQITLVLASRSGSLEEKMNIGRVQVSGPPADQRYQINVNSLLDRNLVFEIAKRLGLGNLLVADLVKRGNNQDPLRLILFLNSVKLDWSTLRDPEVEEVEFTTELLKSSGNLPKVRFRVDEVPDPAVVTISEQ